MAQVQHYDVGDIWLPQWTFTVNGTQTDPSSITFTTVDPAGTLAVTSVPNPLAPPAGVTRVSAGVYRLAVTINAVGYWYAKGVGAGAVVAAEYQEAIADPDPVTGLGLSTSALVGFGETKDWLQRHKIETKDDLDLVRVINDVSDRFHMEAEREFKPKGTNPQTRTFEPYIRPTDPWYIDGEFQGDLSIQSIKVGDLASFTAVSILDYDWSTVLSSPALTLIEALPRNRGTTEPIRELRFHSDVTDLAIGRRITVTGNWGFPAVPGDVRQAVLDGVAAVLDRDVAHYRQDLQQGPAGEAGGTTVMVAGGGQRMLSLPQTSLAVAWRYRDVLIG